MTRCGHYQTHLNVLHPQIAKNERKDSMTGCSPLSYTTAARRHSQSTTLLRTLHRGRDLDGGTCSGCIGGDRTLKPPVFRAAYGRHEVGWGSGSRCIGGVPEPHASTRSMHSLAPYILDLYDWITGTEASLPEE